MKRQCFLLVLITAIMGLCVCSCSKNNDEEDTPSSVVVKDDGTTSNGSIFSAIDDKNFYLDYVKYTVEEGHLVVSGYDKVGFKGVAKITSRITYKGNTYEVLSIGREAFSRCTNLTAIEIPNIIKSIGIEAFMNCSGLTSIEIPNSVTNIGERAFYGCTVLTSVVIGNNVTNIGEDAFKGCYIISQNFINNSKLNDNNNWGATLCDEETKDGLLIKNNIIVKCIPNVTSVAIPNSVISIGEAAFVGCTGLTSIEIPNSVTSIGGYAFTGCKGLTSIIIPNSMTSIGNSAFMNCSGLTSIEIPNSVTSIGEWAFWGCEGLTSIEIPNSVTNIGESAFAYCTGLTSIEIPNSVTSIGSGAFSRCTGLSSVVLDCSNIGSWFRGLTSIKEITLGKHVTSISSNAFENTGLNTVYSLITNPHNVALGSGTFGTKRDSLFVPTGTINQYLSSNWKNFFKFIIDGDNIVNTEQGGNNQNEVIQDNYYKYQDSFNFQGVGTMTMIGEATFQSGKCTAIAITYIYPSKNFASTVWKSYQDDEKMKDELPFYSYDGYKTIVYRFDSETVASYSATLGKQGVCDLIKYTVQTTMSSLSDSISK